jgi:hypothetical protein
MKWTSIAGLPAVAPLPDLRSGRAVTLGSYFRVQQPEG